MIFIESASLSFISKILQISISSPVILNNPIIVPLCVGSACNPPFYFAEHGSQTISSNLIVLRKALGEDVGEVMARGRDDLSTLHFKRGDRQRQATTNDGSIAGGFDAFLIQTVGGHTTDIGPIETDNSERYSIQNASKEEKEDLQVHKR